MVDRWLSIKFALYPSVGFWETWVYRRRTPAPGAESIKQSYDVRKLRVRKATWHIVAVDRK